MKRKALIYISLFQSLGILIYCSLVGLIFWKGNQWFGTMNRYLGPVLFLSLFVVSAAICLLIFGGQAFLLFWEKKKPKQALQLLSYTTGWLVLFVLSIMLTIVLIKYIKKPTAA